MTDYIKLAEAPTLVIRMPLCSACCVELEYEDGLVCPVCGTLWDARAGDGEEGELYESWSGETLDSNPLNEHGAFEVGLKWERDRDAAIRARWEAAA